MFASRNVILSLSTIHCPFKKRCIGGLNKRKSMSFMDSLAEDLTGIFTRHPVESVVGLLAMEIVSIYGTHRLIVASGIQVPAEFAVAFAAGRMLRRVRLPIEIAGAAGLKAVVPALSRVKISALIGVVPESIRQKVAANEATKNARQKLAQILDNYGVSYLIAARWTGVAVVTSMYTCIRYGVDVTPIFEFLQISQYGSVLGSWAAAVSLSSILYPFTILFGGLLGQRLAFLRKRFMS